jgi:hypothetical protein
MSFSRSTRVSPAMVPSPDVSIVLAAVGATLPTSLCATAEGLPDLVSYDTVSVESIENSPSSTETSPTVSPG